MLGTRHRSVPLRLQWQSIAAAGRAGLEEDAEHKPNIYASQHKWLGRDSVQMKVCEMRTRSMSCLLSKAGDVVTSAQLNDAIGLCSPYMLLCLSAWQRALHAGRLCLGMPIGSEGR